jgi:orotidine-5'-phosphate decarboxylase
MKPSRDFLCLAVDSPRDNLRGLAHSLREFVGTFKVGLWLFTARGPDSIRELRGADVEVFLDLKLHDIPSTVEAAAREAAALDVSILTTHASGSEAMIRAAVKGAAEGSRARGGRPTRVVAVTVLTSLDDEALSQVGLKGTTGEAVARLTALARKSGAAGVVCSPSEAAAVRSSWPEAFIITPGIRPEGAEKGDQARTATPAGAIRAGADLLVIGRPILDAKEPVEAAQRLGAEVASAMSASRL